MTANTQTLGNLPAQLDLAVGGMTCSSCANRIERKLNRLEGVAASVNFATETASVTYNPELVSADDLIAAVEATGYTARLPLQPAMAAKTEVTDAPARTDHDHTDSLRQRLSICAVLTVPVLAMSMIPLLQFRFWQWLSLVLAAPVVLWGAWPFHRAAALNARHRTATMDTLISVGVLAALSWSVWALFNGGAGEPGMTMPFRLVPTSSSGTDIYLEVASGVTTLTALA